MRSDAHLAPMACWVYKNVISTSPFSFRTMGIRGLNSFVENNFKNWERKKVNGTLVLDGYSVIYHVCDKKLNWYHGGQYGQFRLDTLYFIDRLLNSDISPIFVFDGIDYEQKKVNLQRERHTDLIRSIGNTFARAEFADVLPLLSMEVFRDALNEREIPFFYVDGEGDPDIVALANHYHCPVVSSDSDFYMFNIEEGYIPMCRLYLDLKPIEADFYYRSNFIKYFKLAPELCLVIPAIAGNDFINAMSHRALKDDMRTGGSQAHQAGTVKLSVKYLAKFNSLDHLLQHISSLSDGARCRGHLEKNYREAKNIYSVTHIVSEDALMSNTVLGFRDDTQLPMWVLRQYRHGHFASSLIQPLVLQKCLLRIVPDDPQRETAHACSRPIRQAIYGILEQPDGSSVEETVRKSSQLVLDDESVERVFLVKNLQLPSIHSIEAMTPAERRSILYAILGCDVDQLERKWQLVAAASCFWVRVTKPSLMHIQALILTFLQCSTGQYSPPSNRRHVSPQWMEAFHCYAQWQCVYLDAFKLNNTLMNPLLYESPAFLFDGEMVMHYVLRKDFDYIARKEVDELRKRDLYDRLVSTISASLPAQEKKPSQSTKPSPKLVPKHKHGASNGVAVANNRFSFLSVESSDSDN